MDKPCHPCEFLKNPEPQKRILSTEHWEVVLGNNQAYFGRAYATLKTHKGSLGALSEEEWKDFALLTARLEKAYQEALGASPLNWSCLMNMAYAELPPNPHVHWHIFPRYRTPPTFEGITFEDTLYGDMYDEAAEKMVSDEQVIRIAKKLTDALSYS